MRTVMMEYCGQEIPPTLIADMKNLKTHLNEDYKSLELLISAEEIKALATRLDRIIENPIMPILDPNVTIPWPLV
jgi:hypothetical protein